MGSRWGLKESELLNWRYYLFWAYRKMLHKASECIKYKHIKFVPYFCSHQFYYNAKMAHKRWCTIVACELNDISKCYALLTSFPNLLDMIPVRGSLHHSLGVLQNWKEIFSSHILTKCPGLTIWQFSIIFVHTKIDMADRFEVYREGSVHSQNKLDLKLKSYPERNIEELKCFIQILMKKRKRWCLLCFCPRLCYGCFFKQQKANFSFYKVLYSDSMKCQCMI